MSRGAVTVPGDIFPVTAQMSRGTVTATTVTAYRDRRVGFHTFGCKLNQFETEALASSFRARGFSVVPVNQEADAYVINTCTVTCRADHKARALIRSLARRRPRALLIVTGCSAQMDVEGLSSLAENILVIPQSQKASLLELPAILGRAADEQGGLRVLGRWPSVARPDPFALIVRAHNFRTRAYLKVQDGCDSRCSYCRVPLARGSSVSLSPAEAVRRSVDLEGLGYREVVITGVNIASYSSEGIDLPRLLHLLLGATCRIRFRLSSLEPECITKALAKVITHHRICPHFHIPVQSGSDSVLGRMGRRSRTNRVCEAVALLRASKMDPYLAADIIVGFPGETETEFAETRTLVEEMSFAALHVFPFSPRPGTRAAVLTPQVQERTRHQRAKELRAIGRMSSSAYTRAWIGRDVEVLLEGGKTSNGWGVSENYLKVDVNAVPAAEEAEGRIARARITSAHGTCVARFLCFE